MIVAYVCDLMDIQFEYMHVVLVKRQLFIHLLLSPIFPFLHSITKLLRDSFIGFLLEKLLKEEVTHFQVN